MLTSYMSCLHLTCLLKDKNYSSLNLRRLVSLPGHLRTQERTASQNRLLSIFKRTISLFLETGNYLLVFKMTMALFDSKIKTNFEEEILYRVLIFVTSSVSKNTKKYSILVTFLGVLQSRVSVQVEISPLFEQRFPPVEPYATPSHGSKFI